MSEFKILDTELTYTYSTSDDNTMSYVISPIDKKVYHRTEFFDGDVECEVVFFGCPVQFKYYYLDGNLMIKSTWVSNLYENGIFYDDTIPNMEDWLIRDGLVGSFIKYNVTGIINILFNCFVEMGLCPPINITKAIEKSIKNDGDLL